MKPATLYHTLCLLCLGMATTFCSKQAGPGQVLANFVNYRFSPEQKREYFLSTTTGKLHQFIQGMSHEDFAAYASVPIKKRRFKILRSQCSEQLCSISYFIKYDALEGLQRAAVVEAKKLATLEKVAGDWKISDVSNIKEFHRAENSIKVMGGP